MKLRGLQVVFLSGYMLQVTKYFGKSFLNTKHLWFEYLSCCGMWPKFPAKKNVMK